jgi:hypothetical protein
MTVHASRLNQCVTVTERNVSLAQRQWIFSLSLRRDHTLARFTTPLSLSFFFCNHMPLNGQYDIESEPHFQSTFDEVAYTHTCFVINVKKSTFSLRSPSACLNTKSERNTTWRKHFIMKTHNSQSIYFASRHGWQFRHLTLRFNPKDRRTHVCN